MLKEIKKVTLSQAAKDFSDAAANTIGYLWERWLDEHEFEDINDYQKPLDPIAAKHKVKILKMTKRPFGCHFETNDTGDRRVFHLRIKNGYLGYIRIG